jgi:hypothetical protein
MVNDEVASQVKIFDSFCNLSRPLFDVMMASKFLECQKTIPVHNLSHPVNYGDINLTTRCCLYR